MIQHYSAELTPDGKMILNREFAARSLTRAGCPPGPGIEVEPGRARDGRRPTMNSTKMQRSTRNLNQSVRALTLRSHARIKP